MKNWFLRSLKTNIGTGLRGTWGNGNEDLSNKIENSTKSGCICQELCIANIGVGYRTCNTGLFDKRLYRVIP